MKKTAGKVYGLENVIPEHDACYLLLWTFLSSSKLFRGKKNWRGLSFEKWSQFDAFYYFILWYSQRVEEPGGKNNWRE